MPAALALHHVNVVEADACSHDTHYASAAQCSKRSRIKKHLVPGDQDRSSSFSDNTHKIGRWPIRESSASTSTPGSTSRSKADSARKSVMSTRIIGLRFQGDGKGHLYELSFNVSPLGRRRW